MYSIIEQIINHNWVTGTSDQQYIYYIAGCLIVVLTCVFIDLVYRVLSHFWHA